MRILLRHRRLSPKAVLLALSLREKTVTYRAGKDECPDCGGGGIKIEGIYL